ncbi:MAG: DNA alkylation repair protein [Bacteroides sp.]
MSNNLYSRMLSAADPSQVEGLMRFFKCGKGQYGEGDRFLGIKVPTTRLIVKELWRTTDFQELERCITSPYHEVRLAALLTLIEIFRHARKEPALRERCINFYLAHTPYINNWDLVDLSCYPLLGEWLIDKDRTLLYTLVTQGKSIWEQRIGIVSTMQFIRQGEFEETFALAQLFLDKPRPLHDLLQKAVGWLLREAGKRNEDRLIAWLTPRAATMPRTMLRYAIERLPESDRKRLMQAKSQTTTIV